MPVQMIEFPGSGLLGPFMEPVPYEEGTEIRIALWEEGSRREVLERAFVLYESLNPGVDIVPEFIDEEGYWARLSSDAASGKLADVIEMDSFHIMQYWDRGLISDISGIIPGLSIPALPLGFAMPVMLYDAQAAASLGFDVPDSPEIDELADIGEAMYEAYGLRTEAELGIELLELIIALKPRDPALLPSGHLQHLKRMIRPHRPRDIPHIQPKVVKGFLHVLLGFLPRHRGKRGKVGEQ